MSEGACVVRQPPTLAVAQADFALDLLRNSGADGSTIISPISISIALAMVFLGAKAETANQIRNVIAKDAADKDIHDHFASIINLIDSNPETGVTLTSANKLYVQQDYKLLQSYVDGIKNHYKGQLESVNFREKEETLKVINNFVEQITHDRIKDIITPDIINYQTRLILVNALYFNGTWDKKFTEWDTKEADFYTAPTTTTKVQMMAIDGTFPYYETDDYQVLGLPYNQKKVAMFIILPRERYGLDVLISKLDGQNLVQMVSKCEQDRVGVKLPRFKIESKFILKEVLQEIGILDAFEETKADFSGITDYENLFISNAIHKGFIEVNESGTEAAAATAITTVPSCAIVENPSKPEFIANHPFLYAIVDYDSLSLLFIGKVSF